MAVLAPIAGRTDAASIDRRALSVVLAFAASLAVLAVGVNGTRARARLTGPAGLAGALAAPWMAQLGIYALALAYLIRSERHGVQRVAR